MYKIVLIVLFALTSSFRIQPDKVTDKAVMSAAEGQLPGLLSRMKPGDESIYGFTEEDDLDDCVVGKPYRILTFSSDFYSNDLADNKDYIEIKNEWRAPVIIKSNYRNVLTVGGSSGNYIVSNMGDTTLAKELQQKSMGADANDTYYLLRIPRLSADFFVAEANSSFGEAKFIPLATAISAIPSLRTANKPFYTLTEVEQMVKQTLAEGPKQTIVPKKTKQAPTKKKDTKPVNTN
jgi:hypothetical protein